MSEEEERAPRRQSHSYHTSWASSLQPHKCSVCRKIFKSPEAALSHILTAHQNHEARINCPHCRINRTFSSDRAFREHVTSEHPYAFHYGLQPELKCRKYGCGLSMRSTRLLAEHYRAHHSATDEEVDALIGSNTQPFIRPRRCEYCDNDEQTFAMPLDYTTHLINAHPHRHYTARGGGAAAADEPQEVCIDYSQRAHDECNSRYYAGACGARAR